MKTVFGILVLGLAFAVFDGCASDRRYVSDDGTTVRANATSKDGTAFPKNDMWWK